MSFDHLSHTMAARFGDAPAIADDNGSFTFNELDSRVGAFAAQLRELGFGRGDVLAVILPNRVELVVAMFAAWRLGGAITPVNPAFTQTEATRQVGDSGAKFAITTGPDAPSGGAPTILVDDMRTETDDAPEPVDVSADDLALLIYTSGSTGRPKGVMLDHANTDAMSRIMGDHIKLTADDHSLLILPLFHVNAIMVSVLAPLRRGARATIAGQFSPSTFFDRVEKARPTYFSAVPTIYSLLVSLPLEVQPDTSSLRFVVCGAAPVSKEILEASAKRFGFNMIEGYGLTEGTCASACNPVDGVQKLGTVGPALPEQTIRIVRPDGTDADVDEPGEVLISGPTVMRGYLGNPEATAKTVIDGWLHTGDVGSLDADGYLKLVDRIKDMIIRGGENIYPKEIESVLAAVEGVLEAAVIGRPDPVLGEVPVAYVVAYPGAQLDEETLREHCRTHLARVKVPVAVHVVEALPKNPVGKISKPALRESDAALAAGNQGN